MFVLFLFHSTVCALLQTLTMCLQLNIYSEKPMHVNKMDNNESNFKFGPRLAVSYIYQNTDFETNSDQM